VSLLPRFIMYDQPAKMDATVEGFLKWLVRWRYSVCKANRFRGCWLCGSVAKGSCRADDKVRKDLPIAWRGGMRLALVQ
jgi:hypothetical protein